MAENAGRIEYEFVAETDQVLKAGDVVDNATDRMSKSFKKVDQSTKQFNTQISKTSRGVKRAIPDMSNMSYQLQDIAVQAQMGVNPLIIMSQQLPQLAVGMGAAAGAIGAVIAVVGLLATSLIDTESEIDKLEKSIEALSATITLSKDGVSEYSENMERLRKVSEAVANVKIKAAMIEAKDAISGTARAIGEEFDKLDSSSWSTDFSEVLDFENVKYQVPEYRRFMRELGEEFGATGKDAMLLGGEITTLVNNLKTAKTPEEFSTFQNRLSEITQGAQNLNPEVAKVISSILDMSLKGQDAAQALQDMQQGLVGSANASAEADSAFQETIMQLTLQNVKLKEGERAAYALALSMKGLSEDERNAALAIYDSNVAMEEKAAKTKEAADQQARLNSELDAYFEKEAEQEKKRGEKEKGQAESFAQGVIDRGMSEPERFAAELEKLEELRQQGLINQQMYDEAIVASVENRSRQLEQANEKDIQSQQLFNDSQQQLLGSLGDLFGAYANNMEVQNKKDFEKKKKFQTAQALINTAMAISNALAAAPPPINFALAAASGAMGAIQVAAIQNQQYSGGRQYGGPVSNGMYRVNETGVPEVYSQGGKDYLMNTKNANITPLDKAGVGKTEEKYEVNFNMNEITNESFRKMVVDNSKLFVDIIRQDKNSRGEKY